MILFSIDQARIFPTSVEETPQQPKSPYRPTRQVFLELSFWDCSRKKAPRLPVVRRSNTIRENRLYHPVWREIVQEFGGMHKNRMAKVAEDPPAITILPIRSDASSSSFCRITLRESDIKCALNLDGQSRGWHHR